MYVRAPRQGGPGGQGRQLTQSLSMNGRIVMRRTWRIVRLASAKLPASGLSYTTAAGGRLMPQRAIEKSLRWRFQVRPRGIGERTVPHRGAGDAWRAHQPFQRVGVLCREVKGLESLDLCIAGAWALGRLAGASARSAPARQSHRRMRPL